MHYLIIAVLAFALSMMGCEGKTGPAGSSGTAGAAGPQGVAGPKGDTGPVGPAGPQGPAGADGADGAQGPKGDTGEQGPKGDKGDTGEQGPKGDKGDPGESAALPPGLDPEEILGILSADHVAVMVVEHSSDAYKGLEKLTPARIGDGTTFLLRKGQEATVKAVVRTQDGTVVEGADLTWTLDNEDEESISIEDGVITALASNHKGGDDFGKYNASKINFKSATHLVAGELMVNVSNAVAKVKISPAGPLALAVRETRTVTASAFDSGDKAVPNLGAMGNYDWDSDSGSASAAADKHGSGEMKGQFIMAAGAQATVTGKRGGNAIITASIEGESAELEVNVSGSSITRNIIYTDPDAFTFTWERDKATPAWKDADFATSFTAELYNAISDEQITLTADGSPLDISVVGNEPSKTGINATVRAEANVATVAIAIQNFGPSDPVVIGSSAEGSPADASTGPLEASMHAKNAGTIGPFIVVLKANGAVTKRVQFTIAYTAVLDD